MATGIPFGDQVENSSGVPVSGAKIYFKIKGTATNATTYTDSALTIPAANPVIAAADGWFNTYLDPGVNYDVQIKSADDSITYRSFSESPSTTGSQPLDATLTALAGAGFENRKILRGTGVDTVENVSENDFLLIYDTLAALQAISASSTNAGRLVRTRGRASATDGKGREYVLATSLTGTRAAGATIVNSGCVVALTSGYAIDREFFEDGIICPEQYGGLADCPAGEPANYTGATDNDTAFTQMLADYRAILLPSEWPSFATYGSTKQRAAIHFGAGGRYLTTGPLDLYELESTSAVIYGNGATIVARFTGGAVLDLVGSDYVTVSDLTIETDSDIQPAFGVLLGRVAATTTAERNTLRNVYVNGWFSVAGVYNYASEVFSALQLKIDQYTSGAFCLFLDCTNSIDIANYTGATVTALVGDDASMNEQYFEQLDARCVQGNINGVTRLISGGAAEQQIRRVKFINSYMVNNGPTSNTDNRPALYVTGDIRGLHFDCHVEPYLGTDRIRVSHNILFDSETAAQTIRGLYVYDHLSDAQVAVIDANGTTNALAIYDAEIKVYECRGQNTSAVAAKLLGANMTNATISGTFQLGSATNINTFANLGELKGIVFTEALRSNTVFNAGHALMLVSADANSTINKLSTLSHTTPDAATVTVAGADVIVVSGGTVASIAGFTDTSTIRSFKLINTRGVSITVNGLAGGAVTLAANTGMEIWQNGATFYAASGT